MAVTMRPAIFIDKDGTLIEDRPGNTDPDRVALTPGMPRLLRRLQSVGFLLVVVTNQAGIAFGHLTEDDLLRIRRRLEFLLIRRSVRLDGFYYCPHHPAAPLDRYRRNCSCRKPLPDLLLQAARDLDIDLAASWMIGDILHDVEAGRRAGCRTILFDNGNETEWTLSLWRSPDCFSPSPDRIADYVLAHRHSLSPPSVRSTGRSPETGGVLWQDTSSTGSSPAFPA